jgi:O-antigen/teichoic acid export membrane protein
VTAASVRGLLSLSSYLSLIGIAGLAIYAIDRAILAAFRSPATVGLYEGPVRAHNLLQQVQRTCTIPVLPAAARYLAEGDEFRTRELLLRGTRYTLAAVVPLTVVLMILAGPILELWLGTEFGAAATAMALFVGYWLINANTGVASSMLVTAGRIRQLTVYAVAVAVLNLALSLALTPSLGLNGVVLGTTLSYLLGFPFFFAIVLDTFAVSLGQLAREAWLPAYATGVVVAGGLISARLLLPFESLAEVLAGSALALLAYWTVYYVVWLRPSERILVRDVAWALVRR